MNMTQNSLRSSPGLRSSCQIPKIAGCACTGNAEFSDPDMHHDTCVTHVPWYLPASLTTGFPWSRWRGGRFRHYWRMHNPQFYASGKRTMAKCASGEPYRSYTTSLKTTQIWIKTIAKLKTFARLYEINRIPVFEHATVDMYINNSAVKLLAHGWLEGKFSKNWTTVLDWWLKIILQNCPQVNVTSPQWW